MTTSSTTVPTTSAHLLPYHYPAVYEQLLAEVGEHEMHVLHEDGLYRHLRFQAPGTGIWHWDLVTWPGSLAIRGDIGEGFIFTRELDMLTWFDHGQAPGWINASYWAEKLDRGSRSVRGFSPDQFRAWLAENGHDPALGVEVESEHEALDTLGLHDIEVDYDDPESWRDYEHHFLLALHAILWGAQRYHAERATTATAVTR